MESLQDYPTYYYYDSSMTYGANTQFFYDWISPSQFVGTNDDGYLWVFTQGDDAVSGTTDYVYLCENITDRDYWYPIASPQGDQIEFLSQRTSGTDKTIYLYTALLNGEGDPVAIETDYTFVGCTDTTDIYTTCLVD